MSRDEYLKAKNAPLVILFIIWCLAVYFTFQSTPAGFWEKLLATFKDFRAKDSAIVILAPLLSLILTGIISAENKARLIFWRIKYALPGHRAFSKLAKNDQRIDYDELKRKLGELPQEPRKQNTLWFSLYKKYSGKITVKQAHKNFLLCIDISSISFLFAFLGPWGLLLYNHDLGWVLLYSCVMFVHYLLLAIVAQNHANRFVCNVIAEYVVNDSP